MTETVVSLELTGDEKDLVQEVLEERHRTLLIGIARIDHFHCKTVLRKKAQLRESILSRAMVLA